MCPFPGHCSLATLLASFFSWWPILSAHILFVVCEERRSFEQPEMSRSWNLRYFAQKLELSAREVIDTAAPGSQLTDLARKFFKAFERPLTMEMYMGGTAMLPTLGQPVKASVRGALHRWHASAHHSGTIFFTTSAFWPDLPT